jgi:hypothetical protein
MRQLLAGLSRRHAGDIAPLGRSSGATRFSRGAPLSLSYRLPGIMILI